MQRKLAAILSADIVGYGKLMERDERGTLERVRTVLTDIFEPGVTAHGGRVVKLMGDGALVEFASIVGAVECALAVQTAMAAHDAHLPDATRLRYRIGVNLGDVIVQDGDIFGEGVNVAARLQTLAAPGGITLSRTVREHVAGKVAGEFDDLGEHQVKNERPVHAFAVRIAGVDASIQRVAPSDSRTSICVLPFSNMSGDPEQEYFSDGVTEDIITDLSRISALSVVSRNTAFTFKGKAVEVGKTARQLGVSYVLEGSVRRAGNRVRISAQLIDGRTDSHIWAERYDRDLHDIFALQTEISEAIVAALKLKLMPSEREALEHRATSDPHAYKLFLMARSYSYSPSQRNNELILRICKRALEIDPNYAPAWALLSIVQLYQHAKDSAAEAQVYVERALELDPNLAEAHAALGLLHSAHGRKEEALAAHAHSLKLDQTSFHAYRSAGRTSVQLHAYGEAREFYLKSAALSQNDYGSLALAAQCSKAMGNYADARALAKGAIERIEQWVANHSDDSSAVALGAGMLVYLEERERALDWAERAMLLDPHNSNAIYNLACAMAGLGELDHAMDYLEKAVSIAPVRITWAEQDTDLDNVRAHPRYIRLLAQAQPPNETPAA